MAVWTPALVLGKARGPLAVARAIGAAQHCALELALLTAMLHLKNTGISLLWIYFTPLATASPCQD